MSVSKYYGRLFPVEVGQLISIVGKICNDPVRFDINLKPENCPDDIYLHISSRFKEDGPVIVRNSKLCGEWGIEERSENLFPFNTLNPLKPGGDFKIDIFVDDCVYFISIDDKPFCTYNHGEKFNLIQTIDISSDVEAIYQVNQKNAQARPWPAVDVNLFEAFAPGQFNPGNIIVITGVPKGNVNGDFSVELYDGSNRLRRHFQIRAFIANNTATLNSQDENGTWRCETSASHPFAICEVFKLAIALTSSGFQVAANGEIIGSLPYGDENERLYGSMTGTSIISSNGLNVQVHGVCYMLRDPDCEGFERFSIIS